MSESEADRRYRIHRALKEWTGLWVYNSDVAFEVKGAILRRDDQAAEDAMTASGRVHDPKILIEQVRPEIEREDRVERLASSEAKLEARILRRVAEALRGGFSEGYHSMGGPQDGDSSPSEFDASTAADELEREARELEDDAVDEAEGEVEA